MKKFLAALYTLGFLLGLGGTASAILIADTQSTGVTLSEGPLIGLITPTGYSYSHEMPDDTGGLPDVVNSATLTTSKYWNAGDSLDLTIGAIGSWGDGQLELDSSTFTIDYTGTAVPFSEPASMLLFGFGLIGLARFGRKKLSQKTLALERLSPAYS